MEDISTIKKSNQIIEINIKEPTFKILKIKGMKPSPRCLNSIFKFNEAFYIFGWIDEASSKQQDVWKFDFSKHSWEEIQTVKMENYSLVS